MSMAFTTPPGQSTPGRRGGQEMAATAGIGVATPYARKGDRLRVPWMRLCCLNLSNGFVSFSNSYWRKPPVEIQVMVFLFWHLVGLWHP